MQRSSSLPIQNVYAGFSSLPNVYIDIKLGFVPHFIAFTFSWEMLNQCLRSFHQPSVGWRNIILIDNSPGKIAVKRRDWLAKQYDSMIIVIVPTFSMLSFSHLQNLFINIAQQSKSDYFSWSHMDIMLLPLREDSKAFKEVTNNNSGVGRSVIFSYTVYSKFLNSIYLVNKNKTNWGLIFYHYDLILVVRVNASILTGPFDSAIPQYGADCDYYARITLKGYEHVILHIMNIFHMPIILDKKIVEEMETCEWDRAETILRTSVYNNSQGEKRVQWRRHGLRTADDVAARLLYNAGMAYYEKKWGTIGCSPKTKPNWTLDAIET